MGLMNSFIVYLFFYSFMSCVSLNDTSNHKLRELIKVNAEKYIESMSKELDSPLYISALLVENNESKYYEVSLYVSDILLKEDEIPFDFSIYNCKGKNVIYYYKDGITLTPEKRVQIIKRLKEENLIRNNNIILENENTYRLNDFISWNLFICKDDLETIEIIKSPYVLDKSQKPKKLCSGKTID